MTESLTEISLPIGGMSCASCVSHVEGALKSLPGTTDIVVNLSTNKATLSYETSKVGIQDMVRAVENVGYMVVSAEVTLNIGGMTCASCVDHVEKALKELPGVQSAAVNLGLGTA